MLTIEIRIQGCLDKEWANWLGDLTILYPEPNETILTGRVSDQAALYGLVGKLRDIGIRILSATIRDQDLEEGSDENIV